MLLVLTYHRILEDAAKATGFFDITADELDSHIQTLKKTWSPAPLANGFATNNGAPGFIITFDDGTADHYSTAAPVLERNGVRGMFFVNTSVLDSAEFLTVQQCKDLQERGHAIESHAHEHKNLATLASGELKTQLSESRRILNEHGLGRCNVLAVPGGYFNEAVIESTRSCGYSSMRTIEWGFNRTLSSFRIESFIINRRTAGRWFAPLITPRFEIAKKTAYRAKELLKNRLPSMYSKMK